MWDPLPRGASEHARRARYAELGVSLRALLSEDVDGVGAMATVACELHHAFDAFDWTGFYRVVRPGVLQVGPYQGGHGCLTIPFDRGVCGAAAREQRTQLVPDVHAVADHIACSSTTQSEIVVPLFGTDGAVVAVLDVDSDDLAAFDRVDVEALEDLAAWLGPRLA